MKNDWRGERLPDGRVRHAIRMRVRARLPTEREQVDYLLAHGWVLVERAAFSSWYEKGGRRVEVSEGYDYEGDEHDMIPEVAELLYLVAADEDRCPYDVAVDLGMITRQVPVT